MDALVHHLWAHAHNNAWANHRLLGACMQLTAAEFAATRTSFFPSIKATLNHNLTVDWYYIDAMERSLAGREPNPDYARFFDPEEPFNDCNALSTEQLATDRRLIAVCAALDARHLKQLVPVPRGSHVSRDPWPRLLAHLFQHQTHHRGQAHAMLAGTAISPPQLDEFFSVGEAPLRVQDFAALGFSEAALWSAQE